MFDVTLSLTDGPYHHYLAGSILGMILPSYLTAPS